MNLGRLKSRTFRRVFVKLAGSRVKIHYRKKKPAKAKCSSCGKVLSGVLNERPYKMSTTQKTKKRPSRPYGGVLCSSCTKSYLKKKLRSSK
ncbi:MAG: 50S ribosomal protein L34e [Candidatus Nanoarchaeia archaeon]|nr:50S ribosomal protein L34e [Candidatus Nanoarchaeia archaeon]